MHSVKERVEPSLGIGRLAKLVPRSESGSLFGGCMHSVKVSEWNHHWVSGGWRRLFPDPEVENPSG